MSVKKRITSIAMGVMLAGSIAVTVFGGSAYAANSTNEEFRFWATGKCLDVATQDHTWLQTWNCTGGDEQSWITSDLGEASPGHAIWRFYNVGSGKCLTSIFVQPGSETFHTNQIPMEPCDGGALQMWVQIEADNPVFPPNGWYQVLKNLLTGYCLEVGTSPNANPVNGTGVGIGTCRTGNIAQRFKIPMVFQ
jgi:hypothetical protein